MVLRVGIDLVEIGRIAKAMRRAGFVERILTPEERVLCKSPARVAGRWAAKEAVAKAIGIELTWHQIEILADDTRAPRAVINSPKWNPRKYKIHISITHERQMAAAVAVLEKL